MPIDNPKGSDNSGYYSPAFRREIEASLSWLISQPNTLYAEVEPAIAYRFEGNFYGLLAYDNRDYQYHWTIMRMNGMTNSNESPRDLTGYIYPDFNTVQQIYSNLRLS